ncbi:hypothetical protein [Pontiella agarivorans]|uniref:Uncharacterized protein n=1 Tax=Pontiella agarivorans TaxID=3038953 RepID=A0ABU5MY65_9BACT|nr:hypothetical protein [Pontiella agarivorans]MDZ8119113.1 hypothetical protein [Pontiella agarivorans]
MKMMIAAMVLSGLSITYAGNLTIDNTRPFGEQDYLVNVLDVEGARIIGAPVRRNDDEKPEKEASVSRTVGQTFMLNYDYTLDSIVVRSAGEHDLSGISYPKLWVKIIDVDRSTQLYEDTFDFSGQKIEAGCYLTLTFQERLNLVRRKKYLMAFWFDNDNDETFLLARTQTDKSGTFSGGLYYESGQQPAMKPSQFGLEYPVRFEGNFSRDLCFGLVGNAEYETLGLIF